MINECISVMLHNANKQGISIMTKIQLIDWLRKEAFASAPDGAYKFFQVLDDKLDDDTELTISFSDLDLE